MLNHFNVLRRDCEYCGRTFDLGWKAEVRGQRFCSKKCGARGRLTLEDRLWRQVKRGDGCWLWTGALNDAGYGRIRLGKTRTRAHRVAWIVTYGPIPDGLFVCHKCDQPLCCRPDHLWLGSHADNMADCYAKGRQATGMRSGNWTHPERLPRGEAHKNSTLTDADVRAIRARYIPRVVSMSMLGREFNVTAGTIHGIVHRKTWTHL
jgi:hypothetical protein